MYKTVKANSSLYHSFSCYLTRYPLQWTFEGKVFTFTNDANLVILLVPLLLRVGHCEEIVEGFQLSSPIGTMILLGDACL